MFYRLTIIFILILSYFNTEAKTDKYRCMWRDDPATTMVVAWNQIGKTEATLYLDTLKHNGDYTMFCHQFKADKKHWFKRMNHHFVRLNNLKPNTVYYFILKDNDSQSEVFSFKTLPDTKDSQLSIIAGGDSRNHRKYRQHANSLVSKLRPDFVMFGGDMTGSDGSTPWKNWLDDWQLTIGKDGRITPIVAARGNHERSNKVIEKIFDSPHKDIYYALNIADGLLRIYTLNSLIAANGNQGKWLEEDLKNHDYPIWKMAQYHYPIRPHTAKKSESYNQQKYWAPLFYKYGMDIAVECDAHVVKTTYPIRPSNEAESDEGFIRDDENGTVFLGEGCWGAPLRRNNDNKKWTRASGSFNQIKWLFINKESIEVRTVKTHNVNEVSQLNDLSKFSMPENIDIWKPESGEVITIVQSQNPIGYQPNSSLKGELAAISLASNHKNGAMKVGIFFLILFIIMMYPAYAVMFKDKLNFSFINNKNN